MQKSLIVLVVGLLAVGCRISIEPLNRNRSLTPEQKQKALRDSVVGEYELKWQGHTYKHIYLENGVFQRYVNGKKKDEEGKWSIVVDGQIHVKLDSGAISVCRINTDKSITLLGGPLGGGIPKEDQPPWEKIK